MEIKTTTPLDLTVHFPPAAAWHVSTAPSPATGANTVMCAPTMRPTVPFWKAVSMCLR